MLSKLVTALRKAARSRPAASRLNATLARLPSPFLTPAAWPV
jgi:hypothetical protein